MRSQIPIIALAIAWAAPLAAQGGEDPRALVRDVTRAVEGDSAARVRERLEARVRRNASDRAARLGLATLDRLRYDYPAAERAYDQLAAGASDRYAVYVHLGLAAGFEARSMGRAAGAALERARSAARAAGDGAAEAEALLWLAFNRGRLEGVAVAEALLDTAALLIPDSALDLRARLRSRRAITHALRGRGAEASAEAEAGIALARRAGDVRAEADGYRALGQVLQYRGQYDSAFDALRRSQELYERSRSRSALASSLIWHAQVLASQRRYGEMREVMRRALAEGEATNNPAPVADAHRALGVLAQMLGDWPAAASHFEQSAAISAATGDSSGMYSTAKFQAQVALMAGDVDGARRHTLARLAWARRVQDAGEQYEAYQMLAEIANREEDWAAVDSALAGARAQLRHLPGENRRYWLLHDEARHALARGDLETAERLLETLIAASGDSARVPPFDARVRLADVHARRGRLDRAERELQAATDAIERWRASLGDADLRTLVFQAAASTSASAEPAALAAGAARVLAALAAGGRAEPAFALAERWRARELADQLVRAAALRAGAPADSAAVPRAAPPRTAAEVAAALPDESTALLEFVAAKGAPITVFVVQRGGVQARVLPPLDSLAESVARFGALIESGADAAGPGRALGAALLDPALSLLGPRVTRVIVVPDGPLHRLPFDALRLEDGRYVAERYALGFAPSASVLVALRTRAPRPDAYGPVRLLALGDPTTPGRARGAERDAASDDFIAAAEAAGGLPRLAGAAHEARLVALYAADADVRLGRAASAAFLKRTDLRPYRVLHFATHAIVDDRSVAGTALALAPGGGESGFLGAGDLAALRLDADLVVLSACRAARGVLVEGEGVQGLTAPLLQAGARSIVATHWRIRDRNAVPLVDAFYAALARGLPVVDALREARLRALRSGAPARDWAAFLAIGDPLVTVPLREPAAPLRWWAALRGRLR